MKKRLAFGLTLVLVLAFGVMAFAEANEVPQWYNDMREWRQSRLETAIEEGLVTPEQAAIQQERWAEMDAYRTERGFDETVGPCHGTGFGNRGGFGGMMRGFGGGMGRGFRGTQSNTPIF